MRVILLRRLEEGGDVVHGLRTSGPRWQVESACGTWRPLVVVLATGQYDIPQQPTWPAQDSYTGQLIHSADYRNARPYIGKRVLVIGIGNSGAEIAADLAEQGAAFVAIGIRTQPPIVPRDAFGMPAQRSSFARRQDGRPATGCRATVRRCGGSERLLRGHAPYRNW